MPLFVHRVGSSFLRRGGAVSVSARVLAELTRLLGADYVQVGSFSPRTFDTDDEVREQIAACRDELGVAPATAVLGGGVGAENAAEPARAGRHPRRRHAPARLRRIRAPGRPPRRRRRRGVGGNAPVGGACPLWPCPVPGTGHGRTATRVTAIPLRERNRPDRHVSKPHVRCLAPDVARGDVSGQAVKSVRSGSRSPRRTARSTSTQRRPRDSASATACGFSRCAARMPRQPSLAGSRRMKSR